MLTGKRFKLSNSIVATETFGGQRLAITLPEHTVIKVISGPARGDRFVRVLFENRLMTVFATDLKERGKEIVD
jgi:hypothetical protein